MKTCQLERMSCGEERDFLRTYLETRAELTGSKQPITGLDVEALYSHCVLVKPVSLN